MKRPAKPISIERLERAARLYNCTKNAALALDIAPKTFLELIRKHNITPRWRKGARQ